MADNYTSYHYPRGKTLLTIQGLEQWKQFFSRMEQKLGAASEAVADIAADVKQRIVKRVESGKDIHMQSGAPLSVKYEEIKRKHGTNPMRNMHGSGSMYRQLAHKVEKGANGVSVIVIYFQDVDRAPIKAYVHQVGAVSGFQSRRFKMPKFEHFGLTTTDQKEVIGTMKDKLYKFITEKFPFFVRM